MKYIVLIAVIGILILQLSGSIPLSSVGGPLVIAFAFFAAALAVAVYDAWTTKRGVLGWLVNILVSFVGVFLSAQLGGLVMVIILSPFMDGTSSLATAGGFVMSVALAGTMVLTLLGSWGALWVVNKWRSRRTGNDRQAHPDQT
jgi:hypothetical protein